MCGEKQASVTPEVNEMRNECDPCEALSVKKVAELLDVSEPTVRKWIRQGDLSCIVVGRCRRILRAELDGFIERHREFGLRNLNERHEASPSYRDDEPSIPY